MSHRWWTSCATWIACLGPALGIAPATQHASLDDAIPALLDELRPTEPLAYFELAERIAASPNARGESLSDADRDLAVRLYVLAFELASPRGASTSVGPSAGFSIRASACLGLASLETSDRRRRWLRGLAESLDARYAAPAWRDTGPPPDERRARVRLARAVANVLAGRGRAASRDLADPRVADLADRFAPVLEASRSNASVERLRELAARFENPPCGGSRFAVQGRGNTRSTVLCPENNGNPGPALSLEERLDYLRFQALLLEAPARSWLSELASGSPGPLLDPDPRELARAYAVDASKPYFRQGVWRETP